MKMTTIICEIDISKLKEIVKNNDTYSGICKDIGINYKPNNDLRKQLKKRIEQENIDVSHIDRTNKVYKLSQDEFKNIIDRSYSWLEVSINIYNNRKTGIKLIQKRVKEDKLNINHFKRNKKPNVQNKVYKLSSDEFKKIVQESKSYNKICSKIYGNNRNLSKIKERISKDKIDISHFYKGKVWDLPLNDFKDVIKNSYSIKEVIKTLKTLFDYQSQSNISIKCRICKENIDISHFKYDNSINIYKEIEQYEKSTNEILDNEIDEILDNEILDNEILDNEIDEILDNEILDNEIDEILDNEILDNEIDETYIKLSINDIPLNELREVVKNSYNYTQISKKFSKYPNNRRIKQRIIKENIDTSHFKNSYFKKGEPSWNKGISSYKKSLSELQQKDKTIYINGQQLKKRLICENILKDECAICKQGPSWYGQKLTLQLDHINGDHYDNTFTNLRILCPNCHSITENFTGRNIKYKKDLLNKIKNIKQTITYQSYIQQNTKILNEPLITNNIIVQPENTSDSSEYTKTSNEPIIINNTIINLENKSDTVQNISQNLHNKQIITKNTKNAESGQNTNNTIIQSENKSDSDQNTTQNLPKKQIIIKNTKNVCIDCSTDIYKTSTRCKECIIKYDVINQIRNRKVMNRPSYDTLINELKTTSYVQLGKKYGVSDNAIRKWIKTYEKYM